MKKFLCGFTCAVLFAAYPVVFLYAHNAGELQINQIVIPLLCMLGLGVAAFGLGLLTKSPLKAALISVVVTIPFANYELLYKAAHRIIPSIKHWHTVPLAVFFIAHIIYFIARARGGELIKNITVTLTLAIVALVGFNSFTLIRVEAKKYSLMQQRRAAVVNEQGDTSGYPDVYHIILDEYASNDTIRDIYGYDNSEFISFLEERGFYHADKSRSRYHYTVYSVSSTMNLEYVTPFIPAEEAALNPNFIPSEILLEKMGNSEVFRFFKEKNYLTIGVEDAHALAPSLKLNVEKYVEVATGGATSDNYGEMLWKGSIISPFVSEISMDAGFYNVMYNFNKNVFGEIISESQEYNERPKYVYAHICCPHAPFVMNQQGDRIFGNEANWEDKKYYLDQYIYVTNQAMQTIDSILKNSLKEPIIIVQSDHGPRFGRDRQDLLDLDVPLEHVFKVFNAIYLPEEMRDGMYKNMAPVNTYRFLFNKLFGTNYEMLEDE